MNTWQEKNNALHRAYTFNDFSEAFAFVTRVALLAEQQNHHPKITCEYNRVELDLTSHDVGNKITERDKKLAAAIDKLTQ